MKRATQNDIAKILNISRTTVARALNNNGYVDLDLKVKIGETAKELGYSVNSIARSLAMKKNWNIYCFLVSYDDTFADKMEEGIRAAEREFSMFGVNVHIIKNNPQNPEDQLESLGKILTKGDIDGLIIAPLLEDKVIALFEKLNINIPVASLNIKLKGNKNLFYVGNDHYKGGVIAADILAKLIGNEGKVALFNTFNEYESLHDRYDGFINKISQYKDIQIVNYYTHSIKDTYMLTKEVVRSNSDLKGIYSNTEILNIARALKDIGTNKIKLVGNDLNEQVKDYIKSDYIQMTLYQRPYFQGYLAGKFMLDYIVNGYKPRKNETYVGYDIVTESNLEAEDYFTTLTV